MGSPSRPKMMDLLSPGSGRRELSAHWRECRDGDEAARCIFRRHYSYRPYADGRDPMLFVGPGEKQVLITEGADALFVWRKFESADGQQGVNCSVFRNESTVVASLLILEAEQIAWNRWPGQRLFTYVNPRKLQSEVPGYCFRRARWKSCGVTKWNKLLIFSKNAPK